jgi:hypothetical protein
MPAWFVKLTMPGYERIQAKQGRRLLLSGGPPELRRPHAT